MSCNMAGIDCSDVFTFRVQRIVGLLLSSHTVPATANNMNGHRMQYICYLPILDSYHVLDHSLS